MSVPNSLAQPNIMCVCATQVSTRRAACHRCDACWKFDRTNCANKSYVGAPIELQIVRKAVPTRAVERIDRAAISRAGLERAEQASMGSVVCIETHANEQSHPWVLGVVTKLVHNAPAATNYNDATDPIHFEPVRVNEPVLEVQLYEGLEPGSSTFFLSDTKLLVPARRVRVINLELEQQRGSGRIAAQGARQRYKLADISLHAHMTKRI